MMLGNLTYLYRALNLRLLNQSMFLGTSIESGNVWNKRSDMSFGNLKHSYSVFLGLNTFMGPVHLGVATAPGGYTNIFFQLGRN
jgi:NTE family protein